MFDDIFIPVLIVTLVGLLAGLILAVFSHFFEVQEDERTKAILEILPGANCAGCGFVGCEEYAKQLTEGKAKSNLCAPGGAKTAAIISKLLGIEVEGVESKIAYVRCQGSRNEDRNKLIYEGVQSCSGVSMYYGGTDYCTYGCVGYGDCVAVCRFGAIAIRDGLAIVNQDKCTGCGTCITACPKGIIALTLKDKRARLLCNNKDKGGITKSICAEGCLGCSKCVRVCDSKAITVVDNMAIIDNSLCTACGKCVEVCPEKVIKCQ
jgi:Na+-translocating ferredoxin:NAD+ oxidoreductase RNF subunit RnfB